LFDRSAVFFDGTRNEVRVCTSLLRAATTSICLPTAQLDDLPAAVLAAPSY
jgi:hypothetical protein